MLAVSASHPKYAVGADGVVVRVAAGFGATPGRRLKPDVDRHGYEYVLIQAADGRYRRTYIHRLVASTFRGSVPPGLVVHHIDGNPLNNCIDNLEFTTIRRNILLGSGATARNARKQACPRCGGGYVTVSRGGRKGRVCPPCTKAYMATWRQRQ